MGAAVTAEEYGALPSFLRSQLPIEQLNTTLQAIAARHQPGSACTFTMSDLEAAGCAGQKGKVMVNCLVKLGRAEMHGASLFSLIA